MPAIAMHSKHNFAYESEYSYLSDLKEYGQEDDLEETYSDNGKSVF